MYYIYNKTSDKMNIFMLLTFTTFTFVTLVVGKPNKDLLKFETDDCLGYLSVVCGSEHPKASDCVKGAIINYKDAVIFPPGYEYLKDYFVNHIFWNISTSGLKSVKNFCQDEAMYRFKPKYNFFDGSRGKNRWEKTRLEEQDFDSEQKCLANLVNFEDQSINWYTGIPTFIEFAVFKANIDTYEHNEHAERFMIHISDHVYIPDSKAVNPEEFCSKYVN